MEFLGLKNKAQEAFQKYRYVLLVVLAGILLMALPESGKPKEAPSAPQAVEENTPDLQQSLTALLGKIQGAGQVQVLLTEAAGEQVLYERDEERNGDQIRRKTVLVTGSDRREGGLVRQVIPPTYQGAVVLCQGADSASIRLSIVEAVGSATGLTSDKITVLKMK